MIALRIANRAPGYGNPKKLTLGQWVRIASRLQDINDEEMSLMRSAINEGVSGQTNHMRVAMKIARKNKAKNAR